MDPFLGQIQPFAFGIVPKGWAACNGQLLPINSNQALFSLLSNRFGGDGQTTFALPNLQGAAAIGSGTDGSGNTYAVGQRGGEAAHPLAMGEMPLHNHLLNASTAPGTSSSPSGNVLAQALDQNSAALNMYGTGGGTATLDAATVGSNGSGQGHDNMMPYLAVNFCMALTGVYPTRS